MPGPAKSPRSGAAASASPSSSSSSAAAVSGGLVLRLYTDTDNAAVTDLWMRGFLEMAGPAHAKIAASPTAFAVFAAAAAAAWALRAPPVVPVCALAFGTMLYTPAGLALYRALLWQGIRRQAHATMRPETFSEKWLCTAPPGAAPGAWDERRTAFFVAVRADDPSGAPVGCVAVKCEHTLHRERLAGVEAARGEASIWRLTTAPSARRLGVGRALMEAAEAFARRAGCSSMSLITGNDESKAFYARVGYTLEQEPRARAVLFGEGGEPRGVLGLVKSQALRVRLAGRNIWHKSLV
jgi:ribosomal protein S18 acetylase RimI-like enzyme